MKFVVLSCAVGVAIARVTACGGEGGAAVAGPAERGVSANDAGADTYQDPSVLGPDPVNGQDAGCPLKFFGPLTGTTAMSVPRAETAGVAWQAPDEARAVDGQLARAALDVGTSSELLRITGYGFAIPASASVKGVYVELQRQASTETGVADGSIALWLDGAPSSRPKNVATPWPHSIIGTHHYGQAVDPWGDPLTPAIVNRPGFGVQFWAQRLDDGATGADEARVEAIRISIFYCD